MLCLLILKFKNKLFYLNDLNHFNGLLLDLESLHLKIITYIQLYI